MAANNVSTTLSAGDFTAGAGTNFNNYTLPVSASGPAHIAPKSLSITADDKSFLFGTPLPTLTASFNSFASGEGVGNLTGTLTFTIKNMANVAVPYNSFTPAGTYTVVPSGVSSTNYNIGFVNGTLSISAWTLNGYYQPVGIPNSYNVLVPPAIVWNTIKGGQTVPLKFNIFAGTIEQTNVAAIQLFTAQDFPCNAVPSAGEDMMEITTTGGTTLRYSGTPGIDGQFIQNWQTPKTPDKCYRVTMKANDGSVLVSFFKTKK
jgi:hypothetical protein